MAKRLQGTFVYPIDSRISGIISAFSACFSAVMAIIVIFCAPTLPNPHLIVKKINLKP